MGLSFTFLVVFVIATVALLTLCCLVVFCFCCCKRRRKRLKIDTSHLGHHKQLATSTIDDLTMGPESSLPAHPYSIESTSINILTPASYNKIAQEKRMLANRTHKQRQKILRQLQNEKQD